MPNIDKDCTKVAPPEQKRAGSTKITSVSLSKEFRNVIDAYGISPTEAMRMGIAIILYEKGLPQYNSETNKKRYEIVKELNKQNSMDDFVERLLQFEQSARKIREVLEALK